MKEKYIFDDFMSYKRKDDKYYDLGNWVLKGKKSYGGYELGDYSGHTKAKREEREETPQEREARLLREKAKLREDKIDKLLGL